MDESGVPHRQGGTTHFVLLGIAVPVERWHEYDYRLSVVKAQHGAADIELHTAWMDRRYPEQESIPGFEEMTPQQRRAAVAKLRKAQLKAAHGKDLRKVANLKRNQRKTLPYTHMTHRQRKALLSDVAAELGTWQDVRIFADIQRKSATRGSRVLDAADRIKDHAFEQVVTRFHHFLARPEILSRGLLVYDHDQAVSVRFTEQMRRFQVNGTTFARNPQIVETPMFVDSSLTSMIQLADLAAYATRRFIELGERDLFDPIYARFDRKGSVLVGARHYTGRTACSCRICQDHGRRD